MRIVIALGGNALGDTPEKQKEMAALTAKGIIPIIKDGHEIIITHGNGPQVGLINLAFEEGNKVNKKVYAMPFSECGALSQGYIGFHLQNALQNELQKEGINKSVISLITQVEVDKNDKAFLNPTKPIGSFYSLEEAKLLPYTMKEDAGRGFRRVIASPKPVRVVEEETIKNVVKSGTIVITCGGGGIPVINDNGILKGIDAVIDKDFASSKLANDIDCDCLLILTAVSNAIINFNKPNAEIIHDIDYKQMIKYNEEGHFLAGSMKPKVEASIDFVQAKKGRVAIITSITDAYEAIKGNKGTIILNK